MVGLIGTSKDGPIDVRHAWEDKTSRPAPADAKGVPSSRPAEHETEPGELSPWYEELGVVAGNVVAGSESWPPPEQSCLTLNPGTHRVGPHDHGPHSRLIWTVFGPARCGIDRT